ncbi:hypothetical protein DRJ17_00645 [Candidatus Woesearchaeota archaeon]|nr:MAG: hypothetical protein DRJ17_00645 [Candidatus Woesearchaeota archaeon]
MEQELILKKAREIVVKKYWNGISLNKDVTKLKNEIEIYLDFLVPKRIFDQELNTEFVYFIKLRNVGLIKLDNKGGLMNYSDSKEIVYNALEKYKELHKLRERIIIRLLSSQIVRIPGIHQALTPLRIVLDAFYRKDHHADSLSKSFDKKQIRYIKFLIDFGYLRKEKDIITLDNKYISKLEREIGKGNRNKILNRLLSDVFKETYRTLIRDMKLTVLVPYIGIVATFYNIIIDFGKNIKLPIGYVYKQYKELYQSGLNEESFRDKVKDIAKEGILDFDKYISGIKQVVKVIIENASQLGIQKQLS